LRRGNHVTVSQLADDFAKYLYLPRLKSSDVLLDSIRDGIYRLTWRSESFAYAERFDDQKNRSRKIQELKAQRVRLHFLKTVETKCRQDLN